jgi:hypothetical protein
VFYACTGGGASIKAFRTGFATFKIKLQNYFILLSKTNSSFKTQKDRQMKILEVETAIN